MLDVNNDKAIEFEVIRYKVNKNLNRLKKIGLRVKKFEDLLEAIVEQCHKDISYPVIGVFEESYVENGYIKAIGKLESL